MKKDIEQELFVKNYSQIKLYLYCLSKNAQIAEDIASDTFYKAISTLKDGVTFKYWWLKIARNSYFDFLRKYKKQVELQDNIRSEDDGIVDSLIKEEEYASLYRAIDLLNESYKEVIMLFYFEQQSISNIAKIVAKSEVNIKVTLYRAREKLKELLEDKNEF